jgi:CheY-like chemotaxis protein
VRQPPRPAAPAWESSSSIPIRWHDDAWSGSSSTARQSLDSSVPSALSVVVVEDEPLQSEAAAEPFRSRGDRVRICRDGLEALASCLDDPPDVVLSDVQMPRMDGWQLLRMLRSRPALATVPVLFLTTLSSEQDRLRGYRLGVDDFIAKPYEPSELVARADRAVVRAEHQAQGHQPAPQDALRGDLEQVSLQSLLSFLEVERKSGVVRIGPDTNAQIYVSEGQPLRVEIHDAPSELSPRELLFQLLSLRVGRFDFVAGPVSGPNELGDRASALLIDHARLCDEGS